MGWRTSPFAAKAVSITVEVASRRRLQLKFCYSALGCVEIIVCLFFFAMQTAGPILSSFERNYCPQLEWAASFEFVVVCLCRDSRWIVLQSPRRTSLRWNCFSCRLITDENKWVLVVPKPGVSRIPSPPPFCCGSFIAVVTPLLMSFIKWWN